MTKALEKQIGGDHYSKYAIQPIEGCIIKYLIRWKDKGGIQDLDKCTHYLELLKELNKDGHR